MTKRRLFVDTAFVQALFNRTDQHHEKAVRWSNAVRGSSDLYTTQAVLIEIGNAMSAFNRTAAADFIQHVISGSEVQLIEVDMQVLTKALALYRSRFDKDWGLTDCISFVVMAERNLTEALTADHHFIQAGFITLLTHDPS